MDKGGRKDLITQGKISDVPIRCARTMLIAKEANAARYFMFRKPCSVLLLNIHKIILRKANN